MSRQYAAAVNRITDCILRRTLMTGAKPSLADIPLQLALRSVVVSEGTTNMELSALRSIVRSATSDPKTGEAYWPEGVTIHPFMSKLSPDALPQLAVSLKRLKSEITANANDLYAREAFTISERGHNLSEEEMAETIAGKRPNVKQRAKIVDQQMVSYRDLQALNSQMLNADILASLHTIREREDGNRARSSILGFTRLLVNATWMTGVRPVEIWQCAFMVPKPGIVFTEEMREVARKNPAEIVRTGVYVPVEMAAEQYGDALPLAAQNAMSNASAPAIFMIQSAKTKNQRDELRAPFRFQVIDPRTPYLILDILALAGQCRHIEIEPSRMKALRACSNRALQDIMATDPYFVGRKITLYTLRHSFATRIRAQFSTARAAALMGHTSARTLSHYGKRNVRAGSKVMSDRNWLPDPDEAQAARIQAMLDAPQMAQEDTHETLDLTE